MRSSISKSSEEVFIVSVIKIIRLRTSDADKNPSSRIEKILLQNIFGLVSRLENELLRGDIWSKLAN